MAVKKSLKINVIVNAIYQILTLLVPLLTTPFISRVLGPEAVGQYSLYFSIVSFFSLFAAFGFTEFGTKAIAENRDNPKEKSVIFFSIFLSKLILSILTISIFLTFVFLSSTNLNTIICYLCLGFYIVANIVDFTFYFQGEERFVGICVRNIIIRVISLVLIFSLIKSSEDLWIYCLILGLGQFLALFLMIFSFKKESLCKVKTSDLHILKYLKLSFPYFIPAVSVSLFLYFNQILLGALGISDIENGYYGQAIKIVQVLSTLAGSISIIMFSRISYLLQNNNLQEVRIKVKQTFSAFWILSIPLFFGIYGVSDLFIPIFLGPGYDKVALLIYVLAPQIIIVPLNALYGNIYYRPNNKIRIQTIVMFGASLLNIFLALILIPKLESLGASISKVIAEFIQFPFLLFYSRKSISIKDTFLSSVKPLISGISMFLCVFSSYWFCRGLQINNILFLFILIFEGAIIYLIIELLLKDELLINTLKQIFIFFKNKVNFKS